MQLKNLLEKNIPDIARLCDALELEQEYQQALTAHQTFKLRLPFVGAFSAGKSTLINSLLGEKLLSTEVTAETCLPAEIFFAPKESILLKTKQGTAKDLTREQLKDTDFLAAQLVDNHETYWIEIGLNNPWLAEYKDLVLVDMPGWDSGNQDHSLAIDNYIYQSGAFALIVSAQEATLRSSIKQALTELKLFKKPVALFITKADKSTIEELPQIETSILQGVEKYLDVEPIASATVSARKKNIDGVSLAISKIVAESETIYQHMVLTHFYALFERMHAKLSILLNKDNLTLEEAKLKCDEIPLQLTQLKQQLAEVEQQILALVPNCAEAAKRNLTNHLKSELPSLANAVLHGSSIQQQAGNAIRQAYLMAVEQDFKPKVSRQLKSLQSVNDISPSDLNISNSFSASESSNELGGALSGVIAVVVSRIIAFVPILAPFASIIGAILGIFSTSTSKEIQKEQQKEEANQYVLQTLIPQIVAQSGAAFEQSFNEIVQNIRQDIAEEINKNAQDKEKALAQLQQELQQAEQEDSKQKQAYQQMQNEIKTINLELKGNTNVIA